MVIINGVLLMRLNICISGLLLILLVVSCIGVAGAAKSTSCGTVYITEMVDVSDCVTGNSVGWWSSPRFRFTTIPSQFIGLPAPDAQGRIFLDIGAWVNPGTWYNMDASGFGTTTAFRVADWQPCGPFAIGDTADVTRCVTGKTIGWWAFPADRGSTLPSKVIGIKNKQSFDIRPEDFVGSIGNWYNIDDPTTGHPGTLAFTVTS
jgi:hypothetical protein